MKSIARSATKSQPGAPKARRNPAKHFEKVRSAPARTDLAETTKWRTDWNDSADLDLPQWMIKAKAISS
jgi:hypothetical protein